MRTTDRMHNGATASDWLGTARTQAAVAIAKIDTLRSADQEITQREMSIIEDGLAQALAEIRFLRDRIHAEAL